MTDPIDAVAWPERGAAMCHLVCQTFDFKS